MRLTVLARLPGAMVTAAGESAVVDSTRASLVVPVDPEATSLPIALEADGMRVEGVVDWSHDLGSLSEGAGPSLEWLSAAVVRMPDGTCAFEVEGGQTVDGETWAGHPIQPVSPCGPFDVTLFRVERTEGPCTDGADCRGFHELSASGQLRVDRIGEPGVTHEATVTDEHLEIALQLMTHPVLLRLLDGTGPACVPLSDDWLETMQVELPLETLRRETTGCDDTETQSVRDLFAGMESHYVP